MKARYYIYRNLSTGGFSVRYKGKVCTRMDNFTATNVEFKVNEKGRQRVIKEHQKNVHAFITCSKHKFNLLHPCSIKPFNWLEVSYNPYGSGWFFVIKTDRIIHQASTVTGWRGKIFIKPDERY